MQNRKSKNTNKATKLWVMCLEEYLNEKHSQKLEDIETHELPKILSDFYTEICKKKPIGDEIEYKNSTLKCMRAGLKRYFKEKCCIDIVSDSKFKRTNKMFSAATKKSKVEGRSEIESLPSIEPEDLKHYLHILRTVS